MKTQSQHLSFPEKLGYSLGDTAANLAWRPLIAFLPIFYTDTFGLSLSAVATLLFITRMSDGVTDIIMGTIADRTKTRWGKFRPWLLWTAVPFGILLALTFTTPNLSSSGKLIWAYATYILLTLAYTANNVPYSSLMGVITGDVSERTTVSSFRFFGAYLGGAISLGLATFLVTKLGGGNDQRGYMLAFSVFGILLAIFSLITFFSTRERVAPPKGQQTSILKDLKDLSTNWPWIIVLVVGFLWVTFNSIKQGAVMYYFVHFMQRPELAGAYMLALVLTSMVSTFIAPTLSRILGKKLFFISAMAISGIFTTCMFFVPSTGIIPIFSLGVISELAAGVMPIVFFSILGDTADYSEFKHNRRATGLIFSAGTFAMKFGGGVAGAVMVWILALTNYDGEAATKTAEALVGIRLNMSIVPTVFIILAIIVLAFYPLNKTKMEEIEKVLSERRNQS